METNNPRPRPRPGPKPHRKKKKSNDKLADRAMYALVAVVTAVWVTSFIVGLFNKGYQQPEQLNGLFASIIGALVLSAANRRKKRDEDDDE